MAATPARIGFILEDYRRAITENATTKAQYGSLARKSDDPVETFFDEVGDAEVMAQERLDMLSAARRRFTVQVTGVFEVLDMEYTEGLPVVRYRDLDRDIDRMMVVGDIAIDLGRNGAALNIWG